MRTSTHKPERRNLTRSVIRRLLAAVDKTIDAARETERARRALLEIVKKGESHEA